MKLMAVCFPELDKDDFDWIQSIRKEHDPQFSAVAPHFSLVFPIVNTYRREFIDHCRNICGRFTSFPFIIREAVVHQDSPEDSRYVFLVPIEGKSQIITMHDNLYSGRFEPELNMEIPYIPHMTIAQSHDLSKCEILVDNINSLNFEIRGNINDVDIIQIDGVNISTLEKIPLEKIS